MASRVDMHCHSTASQLSRLGVQRSLGLPECATPPEEVYELAKRRGMDFVTITDHDTIDGCLELADRPDCFVSEELTARFAGEPQAVHVLCYGITPGDHEWLQAHAGDLEACAAYLHENEITCALAHPFYNVDAPLTQRHRRRLAELFPVWEVRNGSRAAELNMPAVIYIETHGGTGIGGSDDHAGVDIGRTFTEAPAAATPEEFLRRLRDGKAEAGGEQGSAAKWAHAAMALATRALSLDDSAVPSPRNAEARNSGAGAAPDPAAVLKIAQRTIAEGAAREGKVAADIGPDDARALLEAWLVSIGLDLRGRDLLAYFQAEDFSHADLYRRARRTHEQRLHRGMDRGGASARLDDVPAAMGTLFDALIPTVPYVPAITFLGAEKAKLAERTGERPRIALIADGIGSVHGVSTTIEKIRELGVPGFDVEVVGTDARVDRRLPAAAELEIPYYAGMNLGVPGLPDLAETLAEGRYDAVHVTAPGPAGIAAMLINRIAGTPLLASYHTELAAYAGLRSGDGNLEALAKGAVGAFYGAPSLVLSPSPAADRSLLALGVPAERLGRWERGVDVSRFHPAKAARAEAATFLGWLEGEELARAYASADVFLFCSATDTYGQVVLEAGASGLPVVAVAEGGPASLVENRHTGLLCQADADHIAGTLLQLASSPLLRRHLGSSAARAARERSWEAAMAQLAEGYSRALGIESPIRLSPTPSVVKVGSADAAVHAA